MKYESFLFPHPPGDNWTDQAKKEKYDALEAENDKLRGQIAELEAVDRKDPAINTNKNLIIGYLKQMENLHKDYGPDRPEFQAQAPAPAALQPRKFFPSLCHFFCEWEFSDDFFYYFLCIISFRS